LSVTLLRSSAPSGFGDGNGLVEHGDRGRLLDADCVTSPPQPACI
jgi:hypothetical protein